MRILHSDNENETVLASVLIMLTPAEADELIGKLEDLDPEIGDHLHLNDENLTLGEARLRQITIAVYTPDNLHFFNERIRRLVETGK